MRNIEFSKTGKAILGNKRIAREVSKAISQMGEAEKKSGQTSVQLDDTHKLVLRFNRTQPSRLKQVE